jgi:hypothetical protein
LIINRINIPYQLPPASAGGKGNGNKSRALAQRNTIQSKPIGLKPTILQILHIHWLKPMAIDSTADCYFLIHN